jgi:Flp pilus assembly protein TadG
MLRRSSATHLQVRADEGGAVLVITAVVLLTLLVFAAYAIDTGIWFVHHGHLQTEADAAALAGAQNFQYPCTTGVNTTGTTDNRIATTAHQYDGTTLSSGGYNGQVAVTPTPSSTYSSSQHNLISQINQSNFTNQSQPSDTGLSGSPCTDGAIDVKLSETNLASFFPFVSPKYITAQARVSIQQLASGSGSEPLAVPSPTPNVVSATLVDEGNNDAAIAGPVTLTPSSDHTTWEKKEVPVTFGSSITGPVGLRIAMGATGTSCGTQDVTCYASDSVTPPIGVTYTRVWANSGTPGLPTTAPGQPQAGDVTLSRTGASPCPSAPSGTFSNFISSSTSCTLQLVASNVAFTSTGGTSLTCSTATLTLKAGSTTVLFPSCPSGGPNGTWTSAPVTVAPNSGPMNLTLGWSLSAGKKPGGPGVSGGDSSGNCTASKPCTGSFGVVQRVYSGASDLGAASSSNSGPILGATVTDAFTNSEIMSVQRSTAEKKVNITINVLGLQNTETFEPPTAPNVLHLEDNQGNYAIACSESGGNGSGEFTTAMVSGCSTQFGTTALPAGTNPGQACYGSPTPPVCVHPDPGNGKKLEPGINKRVNGSENANTCVNPNHWTAPNVLSRVLAPPPDPRLVTLMVVDYGSFKEVSGASAKIPVRAFAEFYITGWSGSPCVSSGISSNGLSYIADDKPSKAGEKNILLGHFVKYVDDSATGTGSGSCKENSFGICIATLTK